MKMARASDEDIDAIGELFRFLEEFHDYGTYTPPGSHLPIRMDDDASIVNWLRVIWKGDRDGKRAAGVSYGRVLGGFETLRAYTDPELNHLEWRPDIKKALDAALPEESCTN